jgi:hypothetical protein
MTPSPTGLTPFLSKVATTSPATCRDWIGQAERIAAKHGLSADLVAGYLKFRAGV